MRSGRPGCTWLAAQERSVPDLGWLSAATISRYRSRCVRFRTIVLSASVLFVVGTPGFLHAVCGLEAALWQLRREALRTQNADYSFSGLPSQVRLGIRAQGVCSANVVRLTRHSLPFGHEIGCQTDTAGSSDMCWCHGATRHQDRHCPSHYNPDQHRW